MKKFSKFGGKNAVCKSKFNKFALGALIASSLVSVSSASWYDNIYLGAEAGYNFSSKNKFSMNEFDNSAPNGISSISHDASDSSPNFGLKVGYDLDFMRVYGGFIHNFKAKDSYKKQAYVYHDYFYRIVNATIQKEFEFESNDFVIGADWTPKFALAGLDFKGILGAYTGYSKSNIKVNRSLQYTDSGNAYTESENFEFDTNAFLFGLKLGAIYELNKNNELEFGFKFDTVSYKNKDTAISSAIGTDGIYGYNVDSTRSIKDVKRTNMGVFVGYNYKF